MPFDVAELDKTTLLLLAVRDALTIEFWRPYPAKYQAVHAGEGCLLQQLYFASLRHADSELTYTEAFGRLKVATGSSCGEELGRFNDSHSLEEVQAAVDRAIGG